MAPIEILKHMKAFDKLYQNIERCIGLGCYMLDFLCHRFINEPFLVFIFYRSFT